MKNNYKSTGWQLLVAASLLASCKKGPDSNIMERGSFLSDTSATLKSAAPFTIGYAIENNLYNSNAAYRAVVQRDVSSVTFGNEMKYGSIVQNDGSFNFATADALVNSVTGAGITVFGHVLGWHQQQNGTYLKNYAGITVPAATELYANNGGFENGLSGWSIFNTNGATITANTGTAGGETHSGTGSMKVVNPTANVNGQWKVQVSSSAFATTVGKTYAVSYWVKASAPGGSIRLSTNASSPQYQGDQAIGTAWQQVTFNITATIASTTFLFDMGLTANTYFIDDASVKEVVIAPSGAAIAQKLDTALGKWINAIVPRYAGKIKAWDVINELFTEDGNLRNNNNTTGATEGNTLVWSHYLGRDYALKAFNYAKAADPNALLFINDYNLETSPVKLDSLIAMVKELKAKGAKIDGIGTQMHIAWNTSYTAIDNMMQKLAATGLQIRVSELDVTVNPSLKTGYTPLPTDFAYQAATYKYVVQSYMKYIPKAQQYGITVWGVDDKTSWLYKNGTDFPLMYNSDFSKKPAYGAMIEALRGQ